MTLGKGLSDEFVETAGTYSKATTDEEQIKLKGDGHKRMAFTFVDNGNSMKCGLMMKNQQEQHALGNNQCPKMLMV